MLFIALAGWRLTPRRDEKTAAKDELFEISAYIAEARVPESSKFVGRTLHDLLAAASDADAEIIVLGLARGEGRQQTPSTYEVLRPDDVLLVEADTDSLNRLIDVAGLELARSDSDDGTKDKDKTRRGELNVLEAVVTPESSLLGKTALGLGLRERYGINVLAVARQGQRLRERLARIRFVVGDILLVQGREDVLPATLSELGCLPLAERELRVGKPRRVLLAAGIFGVAISLAAINVLSAPVALVGAAMLMVLTGLLSLSEMYRNIDGAIIVLLGAMIPIGQAMETTGGDLLIASALLEVAGSASPAATLAILITATMLLSNVINNAAAAILVAPIAIRLAGGLEASADPFLMAVAIGASCAFLTPIGHQSNTLVMAPGGYRFGDYWRMGLPLSVLVVATAVPLILWVWPL